MYKAIQNGFDAYFTTAAALIDDLSLASREGRLREALARYVQPNAILNVTFSRNIEQKGQLWQDYVYADLTGASVAPYALIVKLTSSPSRR